MCIELQNVSAAKICNSHDDMSVTFALRVQLLEPILNAYNDVSVVEAYLAHAKHGECL